MRAIAGMLVATVLGCSAGQGGSSRAPSDASAAHDATPATFGASPCGKCVTSTCSTAIAACNATPDCASYLMCVDACPLAADGNVEAACASGCPQPSSSPGQQGASQLTRCRTVGAGASCSSCGDKASGSDAGKTNAIADAGILHEDCAIDDDAANGCAACIHEKCCTTRLDCLDDPSCFALSYCESNCRSGLPDDAGATAQPPDGGGSYSCDLWCGAASNSGLDEWALFLACSNTLCSSASACGGGNSCSVCYNRYCESENLALNATPDGYLYGDCVAQCATTDTVCNDNCLTSYPSVMAPLSAFTTCVQQHCSVCD